MTHTRLNRSKQKTNHDTSTASSRTVSAEKTSYTPIWANALPLQRKLTINQPGDVYEQEADRVAEEVMRMPAASVQRCGCGGIGGEDGESPACKAKRLGLQRKGGDVAHTQAPPSVHQTLARGGQPLDGGTRDFMESRFGADFGDVRVHTDSQAAQSAAEVNAKAYTVGQDVVFGARQFAPGTSEGQNLIAHELTHTMQQRSWKHHVSRADQTATEAVMHLGTAARTGLQFFPTNVSDTRVGPVSVLPGLLSQGGARLNVIVGGNLSIRRMARMLLPLYVTATPFQLSPGSAPVPLTIIDEESLARGLLVYNRFFLGIPSMTQWRTGLRFPLPIEIDTVTGMATLNPDIIQQLATGFDPAWQPLLDQAAGATAPPPAATTQADVSAFLARETNPLGRGLHLGARATTNAIEALPFIGEVFNQLGANSFDVALEFMNNLVNTDMQLLASQRDGAAIIAVIRAALNAAPVILSPQRQQELARANGMFTRVAGTVALAPPTAARTRAEKVVTIDTVRLDGSNHTPSANVAIANAILAQCNIRLVHGVDTTVSNAQTITWLGANTALQTSPVCGSLTTEERSLFQGATAQFGLTARFRTFFVRALTGTGAAGYSMPPFCATGTAAFVRNMVILSNLADSSDLAHEIGHILLNSGAHPGIPNVMNTVGPPEGVTFTDTQCNTMYNNA